MNGRRRWTSPLLLLVIAGGVLLAMPASSIGSDSSAKSGSGAKAKYRIGLVLPLLSNPAISPIRDGAVREGKKKDVQVLVTGTNDPSAQNNALMTYINLKVDALIFDPIDSAAISPAVQRANAEGIPVIGVIGGADKGRIATLISPDWYKIGLTSGQLTANGFCKSLNPCNVAIVGEANAPGPGLDSGKGLVSGT